MPTRSSGARSIQTAAITDASDALSIASGPPCLVRRVVGGKRAGGGPGRLRPAPLAGLILAPPPDVTLAAPGVLAERIRALDAPHMSALNVLCRAPSKAQRRRSLPRLVRRRQRSPTADVCRNAGTQWCAAQIHVARRTDRHRPQSAQTVRQISLRRHRFLLLAHKERHLTQAVQAFRTIALETANHTPTAEHDPVSRLPA